MSAEEAAVKHAVQSVLQEQGFAPEAAMVTECVVIAGWLDAEDDWCWSLVRAGSPWGTRGLIDSAIESVEGEITATDDE
jgi:hypothetical protein